MPKCDFNKLLCNFIEVALRHGCSPVNLLHIFRTTFPKNTSRRLLLKVYGNALHFQGNYRNLKIKMEDKVTYVNHCFTNGNISEIQTLWMVVNREHRDST